MCGETDLANVLRDSCRNRFEMLRSLGCLRGRALSARLLMCVVLMLSLRRVWQQVWSTNNFTASTQDSTQILRATPKSLTFSINGCFILKIPLSYKKISTIHFCIFKPTLDSELCVATCFFISIFELYRMIYVLSLTHEGCFHIHLLSEGTFLRAHIKSETCMYKQDFVTSPLVWRQSCTRNFETYRTYTENRLLLVE